MGTLFSVQVSANAAEDIVNDSTNVVVDNIQECRSNLEKQQLINISNNKNENIDVGDINFDQAATINTTCIQNNTVTNKLADKIQDKLNQQAKNLNKSFALFSGQEDFNFDYSETDLVTNIAERFKNKCVNDISNAQDIVLTNNKNGEARVYSSNFTQTTDSVLKCVQEDSATQRIKRDITRKFQQKSQNSAISPLISIIFYIVIGFAIVGGIILVIIFAGDFSGGGSSSSSDKTSTEANTAEKSATTSTEANTAEKSATTSTEAETAAETAAEV
jgi:type III secretory pathway component EscV